MSRYLRIDIEGPYVGTDRTSYVELTGDETEAVLDEIAYDAYLEYASYGYSVVDEGDVPEGER